jgi:pimeloyl-ACP methyl ester carboxylesterase
MAWPAWAAISTAWRWRSAEHYRVVCPDVVGRGRSDWLREPMHYVVPQYVADMVTLIARINAQSVHWVGTSMGGLIGISLAGLADSPISRLVINDVGPRLDAAALARIGSYVGKPVRFATLDEAIDYVSAVAAPFGLGTREQWREITEPALRADGDGWVLSLRPADRRAFRRGHAAGCGGGRGGDVGAVRLDSLPDADHPWRRFRPALPRDR